MLRNQGIASTNLFRVIIRVIVLLLPLTLAFAFHLIRFYAIRLFFTFNAIDDQEDLFELAPISCPFIGWQ
jgi:hypothetical protein